MESISESLALKFSAVVLDLAFATWVKTKTTRGLRFCLGAAVVVVVGAGVVGAIVVIEVCC